jgi:hypothetical protein
LRQGCDTYLVEEVLALLDPGVAGFVGGGAGSSGTVDLVIMLGVREIQMSALHEGGDLFKLVVSISLVVKHDAVEDLSEVGVQVVGDGSADLLGSVELVSDFLQRFRSDAHFYF